MSHDPEKVAAPDGRPSLAELAPLVTCALSQYGMASARTESLRYYNNATFRVSGEGLVAHVLRVTSNHVSQLELEAEMQWLRAMQGVPGVRVPLPVAALDGRLIVEAYAAGFPAPRRCNLFCWLDGTQRLEESLDGSDFSKLGTATAKLHERSRAFATPRTFVRPHWDTRHWDELEVGDTYRRIVAHLERYFSADAMQRFSTLVRECRAWMRENALSAEQYGLVHGDLHAGNCLFDVAGIAFIDFEDLGWGYYVYDVATMLFGMLDRPDYPALVSAFARGYGAVRPLPEPFSERLAQFQALRAVFLTSLVVTRGDLAESAWWEGYVTSKLRLLTSDVTA